MASPHLPKRKLGPPNTEGPQEIRHEKKFLAPPPPPPQKNICGWGVQWGGGEE